MFGYLSGYGNDVFDELERMRRQMDQAFGTWPGSSSIRSAAAGSFPAINVGAAPDRVEVYVFAPGLDPKTLDLTLQQNLLTLAGERQVELPETAQIYRNERFSGAFRRVLTLPDDVDPDKVSAAYRDGVLHIQVERREAVRPRQIDVK
jgi:HSP20 family protein